MRRVPPGAPILTADAMRRAEASAFAGGIAQTELMERAGLTVAREVHRYAQDRPILVLAGPGNNGGDAYIAARLLGDWGHDVMVAALGEPGIGAAVDARGRWSGTVSDVDEASPRAVLVDGLFGTGLTRPIDPALAIRLASLREAASFCVAIDVASGLDTDRGTPLGYALRADLTVALGALKPCYLLGDGAACSGHVILASLGIDIPIGWTTLAQPENLRPERTSHKFTRGFALIVGGAMPGASRLSAVAALRAGAGYVILSGPAGQGSPFDAIVSRKVADTTDLTALLVDRSVDAMCIGPGLGRDDRACQLLEAALASDVRLVLDGDALTLLSRTAAEQIARRTASTILTPHGGEFEQMFGQSEGSKIDCTRDAARQTGAIVVHKGADTVIAHPDGRVLVSAAAPPTLATAGSGDVLAGLITGRLVTGGDPWAAVSEAAWLHMRAAELAGPGLVADDLIAHSAAAMQEVW